MKQRLLEYTIILLTVTSFLLPSDSPTSRINIAPHEKPCADAATTPKANPVIPSNALAINAMPKPTFVFPPAEDVANAEQRSSSMLSFDALSTSINPEFKRRRASQHDHAIAVAKAAILSLRPRTTRLSSSQRPSTSTSGHNQSVTAAASTGSDMIFTECMPQDEESAVQKEVKNAHETSIRRARASIIALQQPEFQAKRSSKFTASSNDDDEDEINSDDSSLSSHYILKGGILATTAALTTLAINHGRDTGDAQPVKRFMTGLEIPAAIKGASFFANACAATAVGVTTIIAFRGVNQWLHSGCESEKDLAVKRSRDEFQRMLADTVREYNKRLETLAGDVKELAEVQQDNSDQVTVALHHIGDALVALGSTADVTNSQTDIAHDESRAAYEKAIAAQGGLTVTQQLAGQAHSTASAASLAANKALEEVRRIGQELQQQQLDVARKPSDIKPVDIPVTAKEEPKGCCCCC